MHTPTVGRKTLFRRPWLLLLVGALPYLAAVVLAPFLQSRLTDTVWRHIYWACADGYAAGLSACVSMAARSSWRRIVPVILALILLSSSIMHGLTAAGSGYYYRGVLSARSGDLAGAERFFLINQTRYNAAPIGLGGTMRLGWDGVVMDTRLRSLCVLGNSALAHDDARRALLYYDQARDLALVRGELETAEWLDEQIDWLARR